MKKQVRLLISGVVQGVFFRASALYRARELNLSGFARNLSDGRVEILAEGDVESLQKLIRWAQQGPSGAVVEKVEEDWRDAQGTFKEFSIR